MLTVITATLPERAPLLGQLAESLACQSVHVGWHVGWDTDRRSPVPVLNRLAAGVSTEWLFRCDDDDLFDPHHFETVGEHLADNVDIVWTWCRIVGRFAPGEFQQPFDADRLREQNYIPSAAAIRTGLWSDLGGVRDGGLSEHEDWDFWLRALDAGARFRCVPTVTWTYRLDDAWAHRS